MPRVHSKPCIVCGESIIWPVTRSRVQFAKVKTHKRCHWALRPRRPVKVYLIGNVKIDSNGCWLWQAAINDSGYGCGYDNTTKRHDTAHRMSWRAFRGAITSEQHVLHKCDVRPCINPNHLFLGNATINNTDMDAKGRRRALRGEDLPGSKLTEALVRDLRGRDYSIWGSLSSTARNLGLDVQTVRRAVNGETWKHVK